MPCVELMLSFISIYLPPTNQFRRFKTELEDEVGEDAVKVVRNTKTLKKTRRDSLFLKTHSTKRGSVCLVIRAHFVDCNLYLGRRINSGNHGLFRGDCC